MLSRLTGVVLLVALAPFGAADEPKPVLAVKGSVAPFARVSVSSPLAGIVRDLTVREGEAVKKGQLLAALDDAAPKAELRVAEAKVKLTEVRFGEEKSAHKNERARCEAAVRQAKLTLERIKAAGPSVSAQDRDAAELALAAAELALESATDRKLRTFEAELEVARAELDRARHAVEATRLLAPTDGRVVRLTARAGEFVRAGDALVQVDDVSRMVAVVTVPERDLPKVAVGQPCRLALATGGDALAGTVTDISPVIDPANETAIVRIEFAPGKVVARVGGSVVVSFLKVEK